MRKRNLGFTLIEILVVVGILALLAALTLPNLVRNRMVANEAVAQATLKSIATAFETYAAANEGAYPTAESNLTGPNPAYLSQVFDGQSERGYSYDFTSTIVSGYTVTASPVSMGSTGTTVYTITTGSILSPQ